MGWLVLEWLAVAALSGFAGLLWRETGRWHPGLVRPDDEPIVRRLCMISWLLFFIFVELAVNVSEKLVRMLQFLVYGQ